MTPGNFQKPRSSERSNRARKYRCCGVGPGRLLLWLKYDLLLEGSIWLGITDGVRRHAARICDIEREEMVLEFELSKLVCEPQFLPYGKVLARFGFGRRVEALLLSQLEPFENYLGGDGTPDIKIRKRRRWGKPTKRHLSLHRFCKALGYAPSPESSGDLQKSRVVGGSDLCRKALWQWIFTRIEPHRCRLSNDIGERRPADYGHRESQRSAGATGALARGGKSSQTFIQTACA